MKPTDEDIIKRAIKEGFLAGKSQATKEILKEVNKKLFRDEEDRYYGIKLDYEDWIILKQQLQKLGEKE